MIHPQHSGVMGASYVEGRRSKPHLKFRYLLRAEIAVAAYHERQARRTSYRVLDLGCAEGRTLLRMRELLGGAGQFDGVELSQEALAQSPPLPSNTRLLSGDVTGLPAELPDGHYDLCVALAVLEHLSNPLACVREALRMLRPGGVFVASCPNPFWDRVAGTLRLVADEHHEQHIDRASMLRLARDAGFVQAEYRPFMWVPTGALPYMSVPVRPGFALLIDRLVAHVPFAGPSFVNQLLVAQKVHSW